MDCLIEKRVKAEVKKVENMNRQQLIEAAQVFHRFGVVEKLITNLIKKLILTDPELEALRSGAVDGALQKYVRSFVDK